MCYAQLFFISEEGNHYPKTDKILIDPSLRGLLKLPSEADGNNAYWHYTDFNENELALIGGYQTTDFNRF